MAVGAVGGGEGVLQVLLLVAVGAVGGGEEVVGSMSSWRRRRRRKRSAYTGGVISSSRRRRGVGAPLRARPLLLRAGAPGRSPPSQDQTRPDRPDQTRPDRTSTDQSSPAQPKPDELLGCLVSAFAGPLLDCCWTATGLPTAARQLSCRCSAALLPGRWAAGPIRTRTRAATN